MVLCDISDLGGGGENRRKPSFISSPKFEVVFSWILENDLGFCWSLGWWYAYAWGSGASVNLFPGHSHVYLGYMRERRFVTKQQEP